MTHFTRAVRLCALTLMVTLFAVPARAQITESERYASLVVEADTGQVLLGFNADQLRHPASLTKMMTLYILFDAIREGRFGLNSPVRFSEAAATQPPSKLGIPAGESISVETAILALVARSANDVATAISELLADDEETFAQMMTTRARSMGMTQTTFRNASGLPDPEQITTARDMATLGRRLFLDHPSRYHYFATQSFAHSGSVVRTRNHMLRDYPGADGIKTGYVNASGFNIVTSARRDGIRLVGVVFGGSTHTQRNAHMASLLDDGFERMGVARLNTTVYTPPTSLLRQVSVRSATLRPLSVRVRNMPTRAERLAVPQRNERSCSRERCRSSRVLPMPRPTRGS